MATSVYERQDDQRRRRVLNILAVVLFVSYLMMVLVVATVLSDVSVTKEVVAAPTSDLLARGIVPVDLAFPAFLGQNVCPIGMTLFGSISVTKHSSRVGSFFAGIGVLMLLIRLSYLWLA